jgi:hypothetical protein
MIDIGRNLFGSLLTELIVIALAILVKDDKRKMIAILAIGTILAGIIGFGSPILGTLGMNLSTASDSGELDCSLTMELGPWATLTNVEINPDRDGWVQADFWISSEQLVAGYDEVSVIFEPSLHTTVSNVEGIAWKYDRSWKRQDVEWCTQKHVDDSWNIRHKRLIILTPAELCTIVTCR